jgi:type IV secretory pathway TrbD component
MIPFDRAQGYVGIPYESGVFDCADLAAKVQLEMFGRTVDIPQARNRPAGVMGQAREIKRLQADLASPVAIACDGCGVLLWEQAGKVLMWHIGTAFMQGETVWVLHNSAKIGSAALQRLDDLTRWGLRVEGFYAWKAVP